MSAIKASSKISLVKRKQSDFSVNKTRFYSRVTDEQGNLIRSHLPLRVKMFIYSNSISQNAKSESAITFYAVNKGE